MSQRSKPFSWIKKLEKMELQGLLRYWLYAARRYVYKITQKPFVIPVCVQSDVLVQFSHGSQGTSVNG
jgi:hypothetical protein